MAAAARFFNQLLGAEAPPTPEVVPPPGASPAAPPPQAETVPTTAAGRPVVHIEELRARCPTTPVAYVPHLPVEALEAAMRWLTSMHGVAFDKPALENRFNLRARIPLNISNAQKKLPTGRLRIWN